MSSNIPDYADVQSLDTFPKVLAYNARNWGGDVAMREKEFGIWQEFTWKDYNDRVKWMTLGMRALGIGQGDVVGIIGENRPEWVWGEIAAHALRGMSVGLYQDSLHEEVAYLITYSGARILIAEDEEQCDKLIELGDDIPTVEHIVYCDPRGMRKYDDPRLMDVEKLYELGRELEEKNPGIYDQMVADTKGDECAILCTTSGTTSKPKMAMLNSGDFLDHCAAYLRADPKYPGDNYVSVLPLPWIMEQVYVVGQSLVSRQIVNFVEEQETMMADLREIGPNFVLLAPRVWETIAADVRARMMDSTPFKQKMFDFGMALARTALDNGGHSKMADVILMNALKDRLGFSNLRSAATGGAAIGPETFKFFHAMGVPLRQLYGQTELCGAYTIHQPDDIDFDTVGVAFDNSDIQVINTDENGVGEIVARTSGMFTGYYKNQSAYDEDVRDGWMHTGDAGYFKKENNHLVVIDRMKDLAETSTGVRYSPQFIENKLKFSPFIAEAVILGKDLPFLSTMICIRYSIMAKWAEQRGIAFTNYTNLSAQPQVYDMITEEIREVNKTLPEAQRIKRFLLLYKELDADDGELTRTRKVRRGVVAEKYADIIDAVYAGNDKVDIDTMITFQDGSKTRIQTSVKVVDLEDNKVAQTAPKAAE
ncbi:MULTISPECIES: long-chain fatty acid--CoA ligase [Thalassospira]|jgi:long-chain acyl-CoA synthetase|uniref:Long-chain fatty acid--CoA ligase n=2 Tax=Thalassospira TaxID=168934 RepID=A0A8I1SII8_9PROT|nr:MULTISPECIES: long-chain fatty acid--CoA ligase [Thalassospira]MEE3047233.1 long-chain fatty acid--CoA ligase [Pseudomonadota bacterium]RCK26655.1 AMP-dependent synthetase [Thalassospira profundimaris]MBN8195819.1 long-chain fatty acid--CoA ligase [Thalassospira povalilytica]MBO6769845.1 long-chain fatty acid--CoA ligase [Thalassospira sp.]MCC4239372.1 long-chain fatty acid--CoA ligase [Thalassospira povalilytica]